MLKRNIDRIDRVETESENSQDIIKTDTENVPMSDNNIDDATSGDTNIDDVIAGEIATDDVPSPLFYGRKTTDPRKVKSSKKLTPIWVGPSKPPSGDPVDDGNATKKGTSHIFDPTEVQVYEFFIQGKPNPKDLEGVEEDQLEIQHNIQEKLKERDEERERNITKRMKQYE